MCLIVFDWRPDALDSPLFTLAANHDEFFRRTAEPISWWNDAQGVLAGRDLVGGGTWLGLSRDGRFAALTNYRAPHDMRADAPTRGTLVSDWLRRPVRDADGSTDESPLAYLQRRENRRRLQRLQSAGRRLVTPRTRLVLQPRGSCACVAFTRYARDLERGARYCMAEAREQAH